MTNWASALRNNLSHFYGTHTLCCLTWRARQNAENNFDFVCWLCFCCLVFILFYYDMPVPYYTRRYVDFVDCDRNHSLFCSFFCGEIEKQLPRETDGECERERENKQAAAQSMLLNYSHNKIVVELYPLSGFVNCFIILANDKNARLFSFCCFFLLWLIV